MHFEELWMKSESFSATLAIPRAEVYNSVSERMSEYQKLDNLGSPAIVKSLKTKKLGEILFYLTELARIDDVNSFEALQLELERLANR